MLAQRQYHFTKVVSFSLMATNVLPQALFMIPRNNLPSYPSNLGLSTSVARRSPVLNSARVLSSRVSLNALSLTANSRIEKLKSRSVVVRAEAEGEAEAGEALEVESATELDAVVEDVVEVKPPRIPRVKLGDIMGILNKRAVEASDKERPIPDLRTGDVVQIKLEVPENKRRLSIYKGIVISKQNAGIHTTIRIRRIIAGIGVEIVFPIYSPNIKEIRVMSHRKVRRARLYYLRDKLPRLSTFK